MWSWICRYSLVFKLNLKIKESYDLTLLDNWNYIYEELTTILKRIKNREDW